MPMDIIVHANIRVVFPCTCNVMYSMSFVYNSIVCCYQLHCMWFSCIILLCYFDNTSEICQFVVISKALLIKTDRLFLWLDVYRLYSG